MEGPEKKPQNIEEQFAGIDERVAREPFDLEKTALELEQARLEKELRLKEYELSEARTVIARVRLVLKGAHEHNLHLEEEVRKLTLVAQEKEKLSRTDALTGLLNRNAYEQIAPTMFDIYQSLVRTPNAEIPGRPRIEQPRPMFNAIYIDLNDFKPINDDPHLGHAAGDQALKNVAKALREAVRVTDKIFRMGGDEFLVLFVGHEEPLAGITTVIEDRGIIATRIARSLENTGFEFEGTRVPAITASIGAVVAHPGESLTDLIARADGAAYLAKSKKTQYPGKSVVEIEGLEVNGKVQSGGQ